MLSESTRAYIYRIALVLVGIAAAYGLFADQDQVTLITALIGAVLGNGMATLNTSTSSV